MPTTNAGPVTASERILTLDIVRGFALLGIFIMNMPGFSTSFFAEADGSRLWNDPLNKYAEIVRDMLFSGKFNSMFSLLFGIGFTIQYRRMQERLGDAATAQYLRRLIVLFVFGVVHACVFWPGDVLHMYAILGLVLMLPLRRVGDRGVMVLIGACLLYPAVSGVLRVLLMTPDVVARRVADAKAMEALDHLAYGQGSFIDMVVQNTRTMAFGLRDGWALWGELGSFVMFGLTMLIGVLAGRRRWAERIPELMPQIRRATVWALVLGLGCGALFTLIFHFNRVPGPSPIKVLGSVAYWVSRVAMMVFYVLVIVRLAQRPGPQRWLAAMGIAGRMPLTNYLMQTAICIVIFRAWGLGLWMKVGPAVGLVLALAIFFVIQVPWSRWWLARHERGPLEALWAWLTYGRASAGAEAAPAVGTVQRR